LKKKTNDINQTYNPPSKSEAAVEKEDQRHQSKLPTPTLCLPSPHPPPTLKPKIHVETHKTSHNFNLHSKFPPLLPNRNPDTRSNNGLQEMASVHELGSGGKSLQLEDSGTHHAKKAVKLRSRIAALDEQMRQVKRGLNRERHRRSSYGGAAASKQSKRREMAQLNQLESTLQMWTVRACDVSTKNDLLRDKINQKRIEMTALKRVFNERVQDLNESKENISQVMKEANKIEKQRIMAKEQLEYLLDNWANENERIEQHIADASTYIENTNVKAMERIDQVIKMGTAKDKKNRQAAEEMATGQEGNQGTQGKQGKQSKGKHANIQKGKGTTFITGGGLDSDEEEDTSRRSSGWKPNPTKTNNEYIEVHSEEEYRNAFEMIGEAMGGLTDPTDIVQQFLSNESNLFDHFRDCERVYETIKNNKNEVRHIKEKYNQMNSHATKANTAAQEKMGQLQRRIDQTRDKDKIQKRSLRKIKKNFDSIATRMVSAMSRLSTGVPTELVVVAGH